MESILAYGTPAKWGQAKILKPSGIPFIEVVD